MNKNNKSSNLLDKEIKVLSLFDGISCGMVALERAGIKVSTYDAYEIEENAIKVSSFNYPQINHKGDVGDTIKDVDMKDILLDIMNISR